MFHIIPSFSRATDLLLLCRIRRACRRAMRRVPKSRRTGFHWCWGQRSPSITCKVLSDEVGNSHHWTYYHKLTHHRFHCQQWNLHLGTWIKGWFYGKQIPYSGVACLNFHFLSLRYRGNGSSPQFLGRRSQRAPSLFCLLCCHRLLCRRTPLDLIVLTFNKETE